MEQEVSCLNTKAIIEYVLKENHGDLSFLLEDLHPDINSILKPLAYLMDENNWVSTEVNRRLFENARKILRDDRAAYKVGFDAIKFKRFGYVQKIFLRALGSPKTVLTSLQKTNDHFNRTKRVEVIDIQKNSSIFRLHWFNHLPLSKDFCLINQGVYAGLPLIWGLPPARLTETKCYFNGDPYCEYHLHWEKKPMSPLCRFMNLFQQRRLLKDALAEVEGDKELLQKKYSEIYQLNKELKQKIKHLEALQNAGKAVLSHIYKKDLFDTILRLLVTSLGFKRAILFAIDKQEQVILPLHAVGETFDRLEEILKYRVSLSRTSNLLVRAALSGRSALISSVSDAPLNPNNPLLKILRPSSFLVVPFAAGTQVIGLLVVDKGEKGEEITAEDKRLVEDFSSQVAIAYQKAGYIEDLALQNQLLEKRVEERTQELTTINNKLMQLDKFRSDFLSVASHEIRNGLTPIIGYSEILLRRISPEEKEATYLCRINEGGHYLLTLVNDLLDKAKIEAGRLELHRSWFAFHDILEQIKTLYELQMHQKNIRFEIYSEDLPDLYVDPDRLKQVLINLLGNALKFTPAGGRITLNAAANQKQIVVSVSDSGPGIASEDIDKLFNRFTQLHSAQIPGIGLGLSIVKDLIELHGGDVFVQSAIGQGSTFGFRLPVITRKEEERTV